MPIISEKQFNDSYDTPDKLEKFIEKSKGHGVLIGKKTYMESGNERVPMSLIEARINQYANEVDFSKADKLNKAVSVIGTAIQTEAYTKKLEPSFFKSINKVINKILKIFESNESYLERLEKKIDQGIASTTRKESLNENLHKVVSLSKLGQFVAENKLSEKIITGVKPNTISIEINQIHENLSQQLEDLAGLKIGIIKNNLAGKIPINVDNMTTEEVVNVVNNAKVRVNALLELKEIDPELIPHITSKTPTTEIIELVNQHTFLDAFKEDVKATGFSHLIDVSYRPDGRAMDIRNVILNGTEKLKALNELKKIINENHLDIKLMDIITINSTPSYIKNMTAPLERSVINIEKETKNFESFKKSIPAKYQDKMNFVLGANPSAEKINMAISNGHARLEALKILENINNTIFSRVDSKTSTEEILNLNIQLLGIVQFNEKIDDEYTGKININYQTSSSAEGLSKVLGDGHMRLNALKTLHKHNKDIFANVDLKTPTQEILDLNKTIENFAKLKKDVLKEGFKDIINLKFGPKATSKDIAKIVSQGSEKLSVLKADELNKNMEFKEKFSKIIYGKTADFSVITSRAAALRLNNLTRLEEHLKANFDIPEMPKLDLLEKYIKQKFPKQTMPQVNLEAGDLTVADLEDEEFDPGEFNFERTFDAEANKFFILATKNKPQVEELAEDSEDWGMEEGRGLGSLREAKVEDPQVRSKVLGEINKIIDSRFEKGILHTQKRGELPFYELNDRQLENLKNSLVRLDDLCKKEEGTFARFQANFKVNLHQTDSKEIVTKFSQNIGFTVKRTGKSNVSIVFNE